MRRARTRAARAARWGTRRWGGGGRSWACGESPRARARSRPERSRAWSLVGAARVPRAPQCAAQLPARADAELGEHLAQVVLDGARADEQLRADLRVRLPVGGEAGDLRLLRRQGVGAVAGGAADGLAGRAQRAVARVRRTPRRRSPRSASCAVRSCSRAAACLPAARSHSPYTQLARGRARRASGCARAARSPRGRARRRRSLSSACERASTPRRPVRAGGAGALLEPGERRGGDLVPPGAGRPPRPAPPAPARRSPGRRPRSPRSAASAAASWRSSALLSTAVACPASASTRPSPRALRALAGRASISRTASGSCAAPGAEQQPPVHQADGARRGA